MTTPPDGVIDALNAAVEKALDLGRHGRPVTVDSRAVLRSLRVSTYRENQWRRYGLRAPGSKAGTFVSLCAELDGLVQAALEKHLLRRAQAEPDTHEKRFPASVADSRRCLEVALARMDKRTDAVSEEAERIERQAADDPDTVSDAVLEQLTPEERRRLGALQDAADDLGDEARTILEEAAARLAAATAADLADS